MGDGLLDLDAAAIYTGRTRKSLQRLYQRGRLQAAGRDPAGRLLFPLMVVEPLLKDGRPSELLTA